MKKHIALAAVAALTLGLAACDDKETTKTETTEQSDVNGTVVETNTTSETTVDEEGNTTREYESKTTVDPEGMMNKETVEETKSEENNH